MLSKSACEAIAQFQNSLKQFDRKLILVPVDPIGLKQSRQRSFQNSSKSDIASNFCHLRPGTGFAKIYGSVSCGIRR